MNPSEPRPSTSSPAQGPLQLNSRWTAAQTVFAIVAALAVTAVFGKRDSLTDLVTSFLGCTGILMVSSWLLAAIPYAILRMTRPQTPPKIFGLLSALICAFCASLLIAGAVSRALRGGQP